MIKKALEYQFIRFLLVGLLNTVFGYAVFAIFTFLHLHYTLAILLATVAGALFNFRTIGKLVFKSSDDGLLLKFLSVYAFVYLLNVFSVYLLSFLVSDNYLKQAVLILPIALVSYSLNKKLVFPKNLN